MYFCNENMSTILWCQNLSRSLNMSLESYWKDIWQIDCLLFGKHHLGTKKEMQQWRHLKFIVTSSTLHIHIFQFCHREKKGEEKGSGMAPGGVLY